MCKHLFLACVRFCDRFDSEKLTVWNNKIFKYVVSIIKLVMRYMHYFLAVILQSCKRAIAHRERTSAYTAVQIQSTVSMICSKYLGVPFIRNMEIDQSSFLLFRFSDAVKLLV